MRPLFYILLFTWLSACSVNPVTGKRELALIPSSQELAIGAKNYIPYQQQQGGSYAVDPDLGRYVAEVGHKLARLSGRPGLPYEFVVLNNSVPNAWALPGGKIAINRGLLLALEDEAQLAAVLGHEIVHAAGKHSVQKMQQSLLLGLGVQATTIAAGSTDYGEAVAVGASLSAGLWAARYGREQELQSDSYGIDYMVQAGYNPYAAVELQQTFMRLSQQQGNPSWMQGLFASHPPSQERVTKNKEKADVIGNKGIRNRQTYERAIAQIKRDQPAYSNHDKAIAAAQENQLSTALALVETAIKQQPEEALFLNTKGQILLSQQQNTEAAKAFTQAKAVNPDYYLADLGLGLIAKKQKKYAVAKQHLLNSYQLLATQTATFHLGEIELATGNREAAINYFNAAASQGGELGEQANSRLVELQGIAN